VSYRLVLKPAARRDLDALPADVFERVDPHILALADNPRPHGTVKLRGTRNGYRVRVGDYRIIYEIDDRERTVRVGRVGHRREVYD
jgi:mRNA interferase RelE/StbE